MSKEKKGEESIPVPDIYAVLQNAGVIDAVNKKLDPAEQRILEYHTLGLAREMSNVLDQLNDLEPYEKENFLKNLLKTYGEKQGG
jgi:hypothetical protein